MADIPMTFAFMGKLADDMTREELMQAVQFVAKENEILRDENAKLSLGQVKLYAELGRAKLHGKAKPILSFMNHTA